MTWSCVRTYVFTNVFHSSGSKRDKTLVPVFVNESSRNPGRRCDRVKFYKAFYSDEFLECGLVKVLNTVYKGALKVDFTYFLSRKRT